MTLSFRIRGGSRSKSCRKSSGQEAGSRTKKLIINCIRNMKRLFRKSLYSCAVAIACWNCQNRERIYPDFDYTTAYFPYQYPVRTLVMGDYYFDNTRDKELKFLISATMGGVYKNTEDRKIEFVIDESLTENLYIGDKRILPLPRRYYTLSHESEIVIPKGELAGGVEVRLTEDFLKDSLSIGHLGTRYVVPVRIVHADTDSLLTGQAAVGNPDVRVETDWVLKPRNFTLFGINYVNEYHGKYLLRGKSEVSMDGTLVETNVYRQKYVEKDEVVEVNTSSGNSIVYRHRIVRANTSSPGDFEILATFDENGNGTVTSTDASAFGVTGTARFAKNTEIWGGEQRNAIYLDYKVTEGELTHTAKDTLVFRDKAVSFQEYVPVVKQGN